MTYIPVELRRLVIERSVARCEYCLLPKIGAFPPHEVDHIYVEKHGGKTIQDNVCYSCYDCNHFKGSDIASLDPQTDEPVFLFHPRRDQWLDHFRLTSEGYIEALTPQSRATIRLLRINDPERAKERAHLIRLGRLS